jgi:hypothetical protein
MVTMNSNKFAFWARLTQAFRQRWPGGLRWWSTPRRERLATSIQVEELEPRVLLAWTAIGPQPELDTHQQPVTGRVSALAVSVNVGPGGGSDLLLGTASGGIWRTTDIASNTPNWTPVSDQLTQWLPPGFQGRPPALSRTDLVLKQATNFVENPQLILCMRFMTLPVSFSCRFQVSASRSLLLFLNGCSL